MRRLLLFFNLFLALAASAFGDGFNGKWTIQSVDGDGRPVKGEITFREEGGALKALLTAGEERRDIDSIQLDSGKVTFQIPWKDEQVLVQIVAAGDTLKGRWQAGDADGSITGSRAMGQGIGGVWKLTTERPKGNRLFGVLELGYSSGAWSCVVRSAGGEQVPVDQLAVSADEVSFRMLTSRDDVLVRLKLDGEQLNGNWKAPDETTGTIEGRR